MPDKLSKPFFYLLGIFLAGLFVFRAINERQDLVAIDGDGKGYYAYLPAVFIQHSLDWEKLNEKKSGYTNDFVNEIDGKKTNKYSPGGSIFILPFFLLAYVLSFIAHRDISGFDFIFQYSVLLSGLFYLFIGLIFLYKLLKTYSFCDKNIVVTIIAFLLGTNLIYYSSYEPSMSHVYAFCCINAFFHYTRRGFINDKNFLPAFIFYALAILIRPTHLLLILIVPFFAGNKKSLWQFFSLKSALVFLFIMSIQIIFWYLQSGKLFIMPYTDEGFYFLHPEILNFLFSFRKGLFIYTPLLFISLFGLIYLFKVNKTKTLLLTFYLLLLIYIFSSWWNWYYGDGFGQRVFIDYYALFAMLFLFLIEKSKPVIKKVSVTTSSIFIFLNLVQTYQYKNGIIHPDAMNFEKYTAIFLKTTRTYQSGLNGAPELFYTPHSKSLVKQYDGIFLPGPDEPWDDDSLSVSERDEFNYILNVNVENAIGSGNQYYIYIECNYRKYFNWNDNQTELIVCLNDSTNKTYFRKSELFFSLEKIEANVWYSTAFGFRLPKTISPKDKLHVYIWNNGKKHFTLSNIKTEIWEAN